MQAHNTKKLIRSPLHSFAIHRSSLTAPFFISKSTDFFIVKTTIFWHCFCKPLRLLVCSRTKTDAYALLAYGNVGSCQHGHSAQYSDFKLATSTFVLSIFELYLYSHIPQALRFYHALCICEVGSHLQVNDIRISILRKVFPFTYAWDYASTSSVHRLK